MKKTNRNRPTQFKVKPIPANVVMRKEALDHFRILMRRQSDPKEFYLAPIPTGSETVKQCLALHRAWNPTVPAYDKDEFTVQMAILKNGSIVPGKTFESLVQEQGVGIMTLLEIPGFFQ